MPPWRVMPLTLFPHLFPGPLAVSVTGRALSQGIWSCEPLDIRQYSINNRGDVDDAPFGGGPGRVIRADVAAAAIDHARSLMGFPVPTLLLSPRGRPMNQLSAVRFAQAGGLILLCGRYEGIDQRLVGARDLEEISVGDFVLAGGEIAAMAIIEASIRLLPHALGDSASLLEESFGPSASGMLEYHHYTRPSLWEGHPVPKALISGHHGRIAAWRREQAEQITRTRRPDLLA